MHLHRYLTDSLEWMEEFADLFVRQKYDDLGLLLGRPVPQGDKSFPSKAWETFRKQRPAPPTAPMPGPTKKVMMFIVIPLAVVGFALTGWWLARRRSQPQRAV